MDMISLHVKGDTSLLTNVERLLSQEVLIAEEFTGIQNDKKEKIFRCTFPGCGREFQLKGNLKRHVNIHKGDKKFVCKFCKKRFLRKADMEVHYRVHTGEKPYRCKYNECGKRFARCSDLLSHERTHTGKKPYACAFPGCDRNFARKFDLHKHQRLHEDHDDALGTIKTKKRKLSPCQTDALTRNESCDCPSDVATPFVGGATSSDAALTADVFLPGPPATQTTVPITGTFAAGRRKMSAIAACLDTPTRASRYELKCPENNVSPPTCFAALSSLDAFVLSQETLDLSRPFSLDAFPPCPSTTIGTSCCPAHLELRPPPPEDNIVSTETKMPNAPDILDHLFTTFPSSPNKTALAPTDSHDLHSNMAHEMTLINGSFTNSAQPGSVDNSTVGQTFSESSVPLNVPDVNGSTFSPERVLSSSTPSAASVGKSSVPSSQAHPAASSGSPVNFGDVSPTDWVTSSTSDGSGAAPVTAATSVKFAVEKACLSTPTSSLLDYSRHNRSCGHLSIQHGNHRDYVVQNHLVCQDSVTRLGVKQRAVSTEKAEFNAAAARPVQCTSPKDTHRPGCGHLPVRHNDHIDYVVEDNLICQQASWLEDDNLELLGDDFWDFYDAIDAFPTN